MKDFFTVKLNKIAIKDNREIGSAEILIFSFITTNNEELPLLDGFYAQNTPEQQKEAIKSVAGDILSNRQLHRFEHISDDQALIFGDSGISLYTSNSIPESINLMLVVMESDEDLRSYGKKIKSILDNEEFNTLLNLIVASSGHMVEKQIIQYLLEGISILLQDNKNDQVDVFMCSLDKYFDYPDLLKTSTDISGVCGNISVDYTIRGVSVDNDREDVQDSTQGQ